MPSVLQRTASAIRLCAVAAVLLASAVFGHAAEPAEAPVDSQGPILTNIVQIWQVPSNEREQAHHLQTEVLIYYFDPAWSVCWGECEGITTYLPIGDAPTNLEAGDRVALDGWIIPAQQQVLWRRTKIEILETNIALKGETITNLTAHPNDWQSKLVETEGMIVHQAAGNLLTHTSLRLQCGDATATVELAFKEGETSSFEDGDFVRVMGVYSFNRKRDGSLASVVLWAPGWKNMTLIGNVKTYAGFDRPVVAADQIVEGISSNDFIRVTGTVRYYRPRKSITLWDETGQITVYTSQSRPLAFGDRVEAIGYPQANGVQHYLYDAIYRLAADNPKGAKTATKDEALRIAGRVQELTPEEVRRHPRVNLKAVLTWCDPGNAFAYVEDASGGVKILNPKLDAVMGKRSGVIFDITGETAGGDFAPVIVNATFKSCGYQSLEAPSTSVERAMTGSEDGRLIEIRGLVRGVIETNALLRLDMTAPGGDFVAWAPNLEAYRNLSGSIIRVQGVCGAVANSRHQLTGIEIWISRADGIEVDEPAPKDLFDVPLRTLSDLRRFNVLTDVNRRLRTSGTVTLQDPGRFLYIQDGQDAALVLSFETNRLQPGDKVEIAGFPGHQGNRFVLRESVFRKVGSGSGAAAAGLFDASGANINLSGLLVQADGKLLNCDQIDGETRLLIQHGRTTIEGVLHIDGAEAEKVKSTPVGCTLSLTGVYELLDDDDGRQRSPHIHLRSWSDVTVLAQPAWLNGTRLLALFLAVLIVFVLSMVWGVLTSQKNLQLHQAKAELQAAHDKLEMRVSQRTHELQEQVGAKEHALAELAQTQQRLIQASRQAGMAEVATGVLHNVGNVLNSINVSASVLMDRVRRFRTENIAKAAELLQRPPEQLSHYLTQDEKGRHVAPFLIKAGQALAKDRQDLEEEIRSLSRNIEHVNAIVSMQQNYARLGGVLEEVEPRLIVEDAIAVNQAALNRLNIGVDCDFQKLPAVHVGRHKALQILINLISNARHAVGEIQGLKRIIITVAPAGSDRFQIRVTDNGSGIAPENLNRIFSQGFTTRQNGHGFGLHSGALAAKELGGSLTVRSEGVGRGAVFTLELPLLARQIHDGGANGANGVGWGETEITPARANAA